MNYVYMYKIKKGMSVPLMWWWGGEAEACGSGTWTLGKKDCVCVAWKCWRVDGDDDEDAGDGGGGDAMEAYIMSSVGLVMWRAVGSMVFVLYCLLLLLLLAIFSLSLPLSGGFEKCQTLRQLFLLKRMTLFWLNSVVRWLAFENRK